MKMRNEGYERRESKRVDEKEEREREIGESRKRDSTLAW
jgi:hypothetical protein